MTPIRWCILLSLCGACGGLEQRAVNPAEASIGEKIVGNLSCEGEGLTILASGTDEDGAMARAKFDDEALLTAYSLAESLDVDSSDIKYHPANSTAFLLRYRDVDGGLTLEVKGIVNGRDVESRFLTCHRVDN